MCIRDSLCTVMIFQLLLPNHLDKQFNLVNITAALLGIVSTLLLAPSHKALGVAWSAVAVQLYTCLLYTSYMIGQWKLTDDSMSIFRAKV